MKKKLKLNKFTVASLVKPMGKTQLVKLKGGSYIITCSTPNLFR